MNLPLTPTNLHTHGLVVQARAATLSQPDLGRRHLRDALQPGQRHARSSHGMDHGAVVTSGVLDYVIDIPAQRTLGRRLVPPACPWHHLGQPVIGPAGHHQHRQAPATMRATARSPFPEKQVRHLILKDMQVLAAGTITSSRASTTP